MKPMLMASRLRSLAGFAFLFALTSTSSGCFLFFPWANDSQEDDGDDWDDNEDDWDADGDDDDDWEASDVDDPPELDVTIGVDDGVMGPADTISVFVDDDDTSTLEVNFEFAKDTSRDVDRGSSTTITGSTLGEGYGDLFIEVRDRDGGSDSVSVDGLLVDLTAPELEIEPCILAASGKGDRGTLAAWLGDAWALADVSLVVAPLSGTDGGGAVAFSESFVSWPSTFGESWDWSYFSVPASELPAGDSVASFTVRDRAGNTTTKQCDLFVDDSPPVVTLVAELVGGAIHATVSAVDDDATLPGSLVLYAGGAEVAHGQAPSTSFVLDAADFSSGDLALEGRAMDRAGNEGRSDIVLVELP